MIGERVRDRRLALGLSQESLACACGGSQQSIGQLEGGGGDSADGQGADLRRAVVAYRTKPSMVFWPAQFPLLTQYTDVCMVLPPAHTAQPPCRVAEIGGSHL